MNNQAIKNKKAKANRNKGLFISMVAVSALIVLATYKTPLFQKEFNGKIMGFSEVHNKIELKFIATVRLANGDQVLASMPPDLLKRYDTKVKLIEGTTMFGRKTYKILQYNE